MVGEIQEPILEVFGSRHLNLAIWVDFWIFSDRAQLLDPESAASKEPRSGLLRELWSIEALGEIKRKPVFYRGRLLVGKRKS